LRTLSARRARDVAHEPAQDFRWPIQANAHENLARYDMNRSSIVNTQDLLRLIQLLNGTNTTQAFNGQTLVACP
jgi:hypothetical protein